jgi:hypothetical protein
MGDRLQKGNFLSWITCFAGAATQWIVGNIAIHPPLPVSDSFTKENKSPTSGVGFINNIAIHHELLAYRFQCMALASLASVRYKPCLPPTEARIQRLSAEALRATTQDDIDRILEELRSAFQEHVTQAKKKLQAQAASFASPA